MADWIHRTWKGWTFALCLLFSYGMVGAPNIMAQSTQNVKVAPDCVQYIWLTAASSNAYIDNRQNGCTTWNIAYSAWGFSALSLVVQSAPNDTTGNAPGTFVTYAGTVVSGVNPNTAITQAETALSGYYPWIRVTLASKTGTGGVVGTLYGWRTGSGGASGGGGGGGGTQYDNGELAPSPTVGTVALGTDGTNLRALSTTAGGSLNVVCSGCTGGGTQYATGTAVGSPTGNVALGYDGANVRASLTDTSGRQIVVGAAAAGAIVSGNPVLVGGVFTDSGQVTRLATDSLGKLQTIANGISSTGFNPITVADTSAYLTIAPQVGAFTLELIAAGSGRVYIASLVASMGSANTTDFSIVTGTGVNCATGTTVLFSAVSPSGVSYPVNGLLKGNNNAAICISGDAATSVNWKVGAVYARY